METTYKLKRFDTDIYVSVRPLMADIENILAALEKLPTENLSERDMNELKLRKIGLQAIHTFMGALLTEFQINELQNRGAIRHDITNLH